MSVSLYRSMSKLIIRNKYENDHDGDRIVNFVFSGIKLTSSKKKKRM